MNSPCLHPTVVVVVDPNCGDLLRDLIKASPAWVTMSAKNAPAVRAIWRDGLALDQLSVTGFDHAESASPERRFLDQLDNIDLHHGPHSAEYPYSALTVIGSPATEDIRAALTRLGFAVVQSSAAGFAARRTEEAARLMRD